MHAEQIGTAIGQVIIIILAYLAQARSTHAKIDQLCVSVQDLVDEQHRIHERIDAMQGRIDLLYMTAGPGADRAQK